MAPKNVIEKKKKRSGSPTFLHADGSGAQFGPLSLAVPAPTMTQQSVIVMCVEN